MKIQSCSLLLTVMTSIRVIISPSSTSRLFLLGYLSEINLTGWSQLRRTDHEAPCFIFFFRGASETFDIANFFSGVKIALAAPIIMYLDTYTIFFSALSYGHSVKGSINIQKERVQSYQRFLSYL